MINTSIQPVDGGRYQATIWMTRRVYKRLCWSLAEAEQWVRRKVPTVQSFQSSQ